MNEAQELRRLIPLNTLSASRFEQVGADLLIEEAPKGSTLFHQGDPTQEFVYVLSGTVSLQAGGVEMDAVTGGTETARFALAHQNPRKVSAVAKDTIRYVRVKPDLINQRDETPPPPPAYTVSHTPEPIASNDWISALLRSPVFRRLPPSNLQGLLRRVEEINVKAGDVICRQDDLGDYFYIIKQGQCILTRKASPQAKEIKLATLKDCDTFGEDALISDQPRSVTVTMGTDGQLLRLDKQNFLRLVGDPVIARLEAKDAIDLVHNGGAWLDVRLPDAYQKWHPKGASNAPFFSLRMLLSSLDRQKKYILVCEDGKLSAAGAYLLLRHNFDAFVLKDGIGTLPAEEIAVGSLNPVNLPPIADPIPETTDLDGYIVEIEPEPAWYEEIAPTIVRSPEPDPTPAAPPPQAPSRPDIELAQARQTVARLEASLKESQQTHERLLKEPADVVALRQDVEQWKALHAGAQHGKEIAEQEVKNLQQRLDALQAELAHESLEEVGSFSLEDEREALRAELDMVREHAGAELVALQSRIAEVEAENNKLRSELQSLKTQLTVREAVAAAHQEAHVPERRSLATHVLLSVAIGLIITSLILGSLFGLSAGREWLRGRLGEEPAPVVSQPAPESPPT